MYNEDFDSFDDIQCEDVYDDELADDIYDDEYDESMDGDFDSAMASAGYGMDEDYGSCEQF